MNDLKGSLDSEKINSNELNIQSLFEEFHRSPDFTRINPSIQTLGINRLPNKFFEDLIFSQNLNSRSPNPNSKLPIDSEFEDQIPIESGFSIKSGEIIESISNDDAKLNNIKSPKNDTLKNSNKFSNTNNLMSSSSPNSPQSLKYMTKSKLYKVISTFYLTKKFINSLINSSIYRKPKWVSVNNYSIINDNTYFLQKEEEKNLYCFNFLKQISIGVFQPIQIWNILWGFVIFILTCFYMIIIPINIGFQIDFYNSILGDFQYLKLYVLVLFVINVFVVLNTAFYDKGELITSRVKILKNYLNNYLLIEFLSMFYLLIDFQSHFLLVRFEAFLSILFFLRLKTNSDYLSRLEEFLFMDETIYNLFNLIKLILRILLIAHIFACIWHYIGLSKNGESWLDHYQINDDLWYYKYISSLYYVIIVMNTVGFGDVVPQNYTEKTFTIFFTFFACGLFAYTINSIGIILNSINKQNTQFQRIIQLMNGYLKRKKISMKLRIKIRKYIEYIYREKKIQNDKEIEEILGSLSKSLREDVLLDANENILRSIPLFNNNFSEETLKRLIFELKEITVTPGDTLYLKDNNEEIAFYFIKNGEIELFAETKPITILKKLKNSEYFGELSFFSDQVHETSARSSKYSSLLMLKKENFLKVLKLNSEDYENYCQIKDKANLYSKYEDLYLNCFFCKDNVHLSGNCPLVHLNLCPQRILLKYNHSEGQQRSKTIRNEIRTLNSLKCYRKNKNLAEKLIFDLVGCINNIEISQESSEENTADKEKNMSDISSQERNVIDKLEQRDKNFKKSEFFEQAQKEKIKKIKHEQIIKSSTFSSRNISLEESLLTSNSLSFKVEDSSDFSVESKENKNKKKESLHDIQNSNPIIISTLLPTTTVNVEKMNLEEFCKSYKKYFIHNNLENVINNLKANLTSKYNKKRKTRIQIQKDWYYNFINNNNRLQIHKEINPFYRKKSIITDKANIVNKNEDKINQSIKIKRSHIIEILKKMKFHWKKKRGIIQKILQCQRKWKVFLLSLFRKK